MKLNSAECSRINEILKNGNLTKLKKLIPNLFIFQFLKIFIFLII